MTCCLPGKRRLSASSELPEGGAGNLLRPRPSPPPRPMVPGDTPLTCCACSCSQTCPSPSPELAVGRVEPQRAQSSQGSPWYQHRLTGRTSEALSWTTVAEDEPSQSLSRPTFSLPSRRLPALGFPSLRLGQALSASARYQQTPPVDTSLR